MTRAPLSVPSGVSSLDMRDESPCDSAFTGSSAAGETSGTSTAAVFAALRVLYLCTVLPFIINLVLVLLHFVLCCLVMADVALLRSGTFLCFLDVGSPSVYGWL